MENVEVASSFSLSGVTFIPIVNSLVSATRFPYAVNETSYSSPEVLAGIKHLKPD